MTATCIPYTNAPHSTALLVDYLYHFDRLSDFYNGSPYNPASYERIAADLRRVEFPRGEVVEVLTRQNRDWGCPPRTLENLELLKDSKTLAVVTGQQVGLFSGPAFTLSKALTTVRLAQTLTERGLPSVPIFWLATEDHDLAEVQETAAFDESHELVSLRDSGDAPSPRASVGQVRHTKEVIAALDKLEALLPDGEGRAVLLRDLRECYQPGATWGQSFARFLTRLFGRWGVILLDPLDEVVHRISARVYEQALAQAAELRTRIRDRSHELVQHGYHAQAHTGDDSTLVFATRNGDRVPVHQVNGRFLLDGAEEVSPPRLRAWLAERPLDFSSNVLLRPLVQDALLPTVAYVAGPSELAYLGQSQVLYQAFGRPQPVVFPRAAFTLVDTRTDRLLEKYQLRLEDVWQGEEHLSRKIAGAGFAPGWSERFDESERGLAQLLERLHADIEKLDPTLLDTLKHAQEKMTYQLEKVRTKLARAALGRSDLLARHTETLLRLLLPHKDLQERRVGGAYFLGRAGYDLLERMLSHIQTCCSDHQTLAY